MNMKGDVSSDNQHWGEANTNVAREETAPIHDLNTHKE